MIGKGFPFKVILPHPLNAAPYAPFSRAHVSVSSSICSR